MLKDVDVRSFNFNGGFLEREENKVSHNLSVKFLKGEMLTLKRIDLAAFVPIAKQETELR